MTRDDNPSFEDDTCLIVIYCMANGNSLAPLTVATLHRGVAILLVPLFGIVSDQVEKAIVLEHSIEAHHIDKHKNYYNRLLCDCLLVMLNVNHMELLSYYSSLREHQLNRIHMVASNQNIGETWTYLC